MKIEITWFLPLILWVLLVTAAACVPPPPAPPAEMSEDEVNTFGLVVGNSNTLVENEWPEQMICAIKASVTNVVTNDQIAYAIFGAEWLFDT